MKDDAEKMVMTAGAANQVMPEVVIFSLLICLTVKQ